MNNRLKQAARSTLGPNTTDLATFLGRLIAHMTAQVGVAASCIPSSHGARVALVGAGPGDPELLTLRAARLIASADCVVFDNLVGPGIVDLAPHGAQRIYVGKVVGKHTLPQEEINRLRVTLALRGQKVVRLKGGAVPV